MLLMSYISGRRAQPNILLIAVLVATPLSTAAYFADFAFLENARPVASVVPPNTLKPAQDTVAAALQLIDDRRLVNSAPELSFEMFNFVHNAPLVPRFSQLTVQDEMGLKFQPALPAATPLEDPVEPDQPLSTEGAVADAVEGVPEPVPLPVPRPPQLRPAATLLPEAPRSSRAAGPVPMKSAAVAGTLPDNRSFLEKLLGVKPASPPASALGYASLDSNTVAPGARLDPAPNLSADAATAVYDISAKVVIMPNGERLEAHSGLSDKLDDPRSVHVSMRGATPPGTYDLTEREKPFHGVRALRMNPVGGSAAVYGRVGLLAHTYMLGPKGDSNGCVSFKDYDRFLQAYLKGEVKRLVVVLGRGQDTLPRIANADYGR
jgi:hypothetical protein